MRIPYVTTISLYTALGLVVALRVRSRCIYLNVWSAVLGHVAESTLRAALSE